jgi:alkylation response protein AidB-like acyl-CoA dehydrogenase
MTDPVPTLESTDTEVGRLALTSESSVDEVVEVVRAWIDASIPPAWIEAGRQGGASAVRQVRTRAEYEAWYPTFGRSGLVAATWPRPYGGLDLAPAAARSCARSTWGA